MQCLREHEATDFHKIGKHYILITKNQELIRLDHRESVIDKKKMAPEDLFKFKLLYHLSATMTGIKPITIMRFKQPEPTLQPCQNCNHRWQAVKKHFAGNVILSMRPLNRNQKGETLVFFHRTACRRLLELPAVREFLQQQGHSDKTLNDPDKFIDYCLQQYHQNASLSAEMGLFMGIPLKDVKGYMSKNRSNYITTRGWQIYGRLHPSLPLFGLYRRLRQFATLAFFQRPFEEIVERLGRSQLISKIDLLAI